ncbi:MAG TPA: PQQ-binding-like beta-propeller repeat protein [Mucilaginibacter sp.]|nr:PQQ-binding-like beta-propeller repeat protein [Mucilaginibacter sp.]
MNLYSHFWRYPILTYFVVLFVILASSCKKEHAVTPVTPPPNNDTTIHKASSTKDILTFSLSKSNNTSFYAGDEIVSIVGDSIKVLVPGTAILNSLLPGIQINGVKISPLSGVVQDFTKPVNYTVTAEDSTKRIYVVVVKQDKLKNLLYTGSGGTNFYALDLRNGDEIWHYSSGGTFHYSNPLLDNGTVYAGSGDGNLYALSAAYGTVKWKFTTGSSVLSAPALANGILYFASDDHNVYAVDAATGNLKWKYVTGGNVDSSPVVNNGVLFIASTDNNLYALDAATGTVKWQYTMATTAVEASPVVANDVVYIGERGGFLNAIDMTTGLLKWRFSTNGISLEQSRPIESNGIIYIASWYNTNDFTKAGSAYAINETDGSLKWQVLDNTGFTTGPTFADGNIFISADDGYVYALSGVNGNVLWRNQLYPNGAMPAVAGGVVYIGSATGNMYALNEADGTVKWKSVETTGSGNSKPVIIDANGN